jgi:hypothetical protein
MKVIIELIRHRLCAGSEGTCDLMKHKTLAMDLDRQPLHAVVLYWRGNIDIDHVPFGRWVVE